MTDAQINFPAPRPPPDAREVLDCPQFLSMLYADWCINSRLADGSILRVWQVRGVGFECNCTVEQITNVGKPDWEARTVILRTSDRAEALEMVRHLLRLDDLGVLLRSDAPADLKNDAIRAHLLSDYSSSFESLRRELGMTEAELFPRLVDGQRCFFTNFGPKNTDSDPTTALSGGVVQG